MSHTYVSEVVGGKLFLVHHDGDPTRGDLVIVGPARQGAPKGEEFADAPRVTIPWAVIVEFVGQVFIKKDIARLEQEDGSTYLSRRWRT